MWSLALSRRFRSFILSKWSKTPSGATPTLNGHSLAPNGRIDLGPFSSAPAKLLPFYRSKKYCLFPLGKPLKKCNIFYTQVWPPPPYFLESVTKNQKIYYIIYHRRVAGSRGVWQMSVFFVKASLRERMTKFISYRCFKVGASYKLVILNNIFLYYLSQQLTINIIKGKLSKKINISGRMRGL